MVKRMRLDAAFAGVALALGLASTAFADKIKHPVAVFSGLDKITGRIISFQVGIDETVQFGSLQVTPRVCFSRPPTEAPRTDGFVEVDDLQPDKTLKRIFSGWMFADSPGLHGIEHPIYDVWLIDCRGDGPLIHEAPQVVDEPVDTPDSAPNAQPDAQAQRPDQIAPVNKPKPKPKPTQMQPFDLGIPNLSAPMGGARGGARPAPVEVAPIPPADIGR